MSDDLRILALETTGLSGSVAALVGERVVEEQQLADGIRSAQSLAPGVSALLNRVGWKPADLQLVGVTVGPGSFTGLRVGITTAKTLAYVTGAAVLGVDTLEVIAAQSPLEIKTVWAAFDAQRGELFVARWERINAADPLAWRQDAGPQIVDGKSWVSSLAAGEALSGPGVRRWRDEVPAGVRLVDEELWQPQAATIGKLTFRKYRAGERKDLWGLSPNYIRASAAEEKLAANQSSNA